MTKKTYLPHETNKKIYISTEEEELAPSSRIDNVCERKLIELLLNLVLQIKFQILTKAFRKKMQDVAKKKTKTMASTSLYAVATQRSWSAKLHVNNAKIKIN
jgi:hypothetical protein